MHPHLDVTTTGTCLLISRTVLTMVEPEKGFNQDEAGEWERDEWDMAPRQWRT
jgi:hypothetical protein